MSSSISGTLTLLNIDSDYLCAYRFGQDTSGPHRFRPPRPYVPSNGSVIDATSYGQACLQQPGSTPLEPIVLTNVSDGATSEDCLNLVIVRPNNTDPGSRLPVLFFIHGGSFWEGSTREVTTTSDGLVLQSIQADLPIIHVHTNYRLGGWFYGLTKTFTDLDSFWFRSISGSV